MSQQGVIKTII